MLFLFDLLTLYFHVPFDNVQQSLWLSAGISASAFSFYIHHGAQSKNTKGIDYYGEFLDCFVICYNFIF